MSFIDEQGRAKQTPQEQLNDQAHDVDGIRPARFGSWGDEGLTFDGLAPDPGEAAREEQMQSRSDFNHEHDSDGKFASGGDDSGGGKSKSESGDKEGAKTASEHIAASKGHAVRAIEEHAKGNHAEAKAHAEKAKEHAEKAKEGGAHEHGGESAIGHFFKFLNDPLEFFHGGGEGGEGGEHAGKKSTEPKVHGFGAGGEGGAVNPKPHHHQRIDGSPDQPRDDHGRFGSGGGGADKNAIADKLVGEMASHPYGFSWRPDTEHAKTGIMVSEPASAGFSKVIEFNEAGSREEVRDAVREYVKKNLDKVMSDPQLHIGGWLDKDEKGSRFYLDVSRQHPQSDRQGAIDAGIRHNQKAVWDVDAGAEIKTGGDGT